MSDEVLQIILTKAEVRRLIERMGVEEIFRQLIDEEEQLAFNCKHHGREASIHDNRIAELQFFLDEAQELRSHLVKIVLPI